MNPPQVYLCSHPEPSSLLPPHTIPLGRPSAPAPSTQYRASNQVASQRSLPWKGISVAFRPNCYHRPHRESDLLTFLLVHQAAPSLRAGAVSLLPPASEWTRASPTQDVQSAPPEQKCPALPLPVSSSTRTACGTQNGCMPCTTESPCCTPGNCHHTVN